MKAVAIVAFKAKDQDDDRTYTISFPVGIESSDGCLQTKNMQLSLDSIESMTIRFTDYI